jgi:UDP-N-acetylglucosamine 2-epimerase (non-hydrolysing)
MKNITLVVEARQNFMKIAPIIHEIHKTKSLGEDIQYRLVHMDQHYDKKMSGDFFAQLDIPQPNANLESGWYTGLTNAKYHDPFRDRIIRKHY